MSNARLLVLGLVRKQGKTHGYKVHQELVSWQVDSWANVKPGSIYHALNQLTKQEMLKALGEEGSKEGPTRMIYSLTSKGEKEFYHLLEESLQSLDISYVSSGVVFLDALPATHAVELLSRRLAEAEEMCKYLRSMMPTEEGEWSPSHHPELLNLWIGYFDNAATWTARLIGRIESGQYSTKK